MRLWSQRSPGTVTARSNDKGAMITVASGTLVTSLFRIEQDDDPLRLSLTSNSPYTGNQTASGPQLSSTRYSAAWVGINPTLPLDNLI
jgi:hypothetical protein